MSSDNSTPSLTFSALTPEEKIYILKYRAMSMEEKMEFYEKIMEEKDRAHSSRSKKQRTKILYNVLISN